MATLSVVAATLGAEVVTLDRDAAGHRVTAPIELETWLAERGGTVAILRPDHYATCTR